MLLCAAMRIRLLAVIALLASCTHTSAPAPASMSFAEFVDAYYAARFARLPSLATRVGLHEGDAKLEDLSRAGVEARIAELKDYLGRLDAIRRGPLSFDDAIDAQDRKSTRL